MLFGPRYALSANKTGAIVRQLGRHHLCHVRNALPYDECARIRAIAESALRSSYGGNYAHIFGEEIAPRTYRIDPIVILHVLRSPCLEILRRYFRHHCGTDEMALALQHFVVRRFDPRDEKNNEVAIPFHQDGNVMPKDSKMVNCWTLLSPSECGETSPGLEFITRVNQIYDRAAVGRSKHYGFLETDHDMLSGLSSEPRFAPSVRLGDVMMFDNIALHRTWLSDIQQECRCSAEVRFMGLTTAIHGYLDGEAWFRISNCEMRGPSIVGQGDDGKLRTVETGQWTL